MARDPQLEFSPGETKIVYFDGPEPTATGDGKYGEWRLYGCTWNGARYAFFPKASIHTDLAQLLSKTRAVAVTRSVKDGPKGPKDVWYVADAATKEAPKVTNTQRFEADLTHMDAQELKQDKEAAIARAVCIKAAAELLPEGSSHRDVILYAELLMPYVLSGTLPKDAPAADDIDVSNIPF